MNRLIFVALFFLTVEAFADPAGPVHVKKGDEPAWLSVTATVEQNRAEQSSLCNQDQEGQRD